MPGFWNHGLRTVRAELDRQEQASLAPLKDKLNQTSGPTEKDALKEQIRAIKKEYREKRKDARYSLFAKSK